MTSMYDGVEVPVKSAQARCLGCAPGVLNLPHQCAGKNELSVTGGFCQCPKPDCRARQGVTPCAPAVP